MKKATAKITKSPTKEEGPPSSRTKTVSSTQQTKSKTAVNTSKAARPAKGKSAAKQKATKDTSAETIISDIDLPDRDPITNAVVDRYLEHGKDILWEQLSAYNKAIFDSAQQKLHDMTYVLAKAMEGFMIAKEMPSGDRFMFRERHLMIMYLVDWDGEIHANVDEGLVDELETALANRA